VQKQRTSLLKKKKAKTPANRYGVTPIAAEKEEAEERLASKLRPKERKGISSPRTTTLGKNQGEPKARCALRGRGREENETRTAHVSIPRRGRCWGGRLPLITKRKSFKRGATIVDRQKMEKNRAGEDIDYEKANKKMICVERSLACTLIRE